MTEHEDNGSVEYDGLHDHGKFMEVDSVFGLYIVCG